MPGKCDIEAWDQFVVIYEPLIYRLARSWGLQDADAREVVQEVLVSVAGTVERWQPDPELGRFCDWLFRIARNFMIKFMTRRKYQSTGSGNPDVAEWLDQLADPSTEESAEFDLAYRREVFRWAANKVRSEVTDTTWRAFWATRAFFP